MLETGCLRIHLLFIHGGYPTHKHCRGSIIYVLCVSKVKSCSFTYLLIILFCLSLPFFIISIIITNVLINATSTFYLAARQIRTLTIGEK